MVTMYYSRVCLRLYYSLNSLSLMYSLACFAAMLAVVGPEGDQGSVYKLFKVIPISDEIKMKLLWAEEKEVRGLAASAI